MADRAALGGDWEPWRDFAVRSAGFPASGLSAFGGDDESERLRAVARDARFREAVTWQNPVALVNAVDKIAAGAPTKPSRARQREEIVASYWQRYCAKNDTIGFFGPLAWGRIAGDGPPLAARSGELVRECAVHLEAWAAGARRADRPRAEDRDGAACRGRAARGARRPPGPRRARAGPRLAGAARGGARRARRRAGRVAARCACGARQRLRRADRPRPGAQPGARVRRAHARLCRLPARPRRAQGARHTWWAHELLVGVSDVVDRAGALRVSLIDLFALPIFSTAVRTFELLAPQEHAPRATIGRTVLGRESWSVPAAVVPQRAQDAAFARDRGMPRRVFAKSPLERKPMYLDVDSPVLGRILCRLARQAAAESADAHMSFSEMLPTPEQSCLSDCAGERFVCELRIVGVDVTRSHRT